MRIFRTIGVVGTAIAFLLSSTVALAAERKPVPAVRALKGDVRPMAASTTRQETKDKMEVKREEVKVRVESKREEIKSQMEAKREEAKGLMESRREEAKARIEDRRAKAEARLAEIKDKKKQELSQRLANQFMDLNKTWTDHFMKQLDQYVAVVAKIQDRAGIAESAGKDVSAVTAAIQSAIMAIDTARTSVVAQAAKTYVLGTASIATTASTTSEVGQEQLMKNIRNSFQELHKTLFADLTALRDGAMKNARNSVQGALKALKAIPAVDEEGTAATTTESN